MTKNFILNVYRGDPSSQYFEEFLLPLREGENVISALMEIQKKPYNRYGEKVAPVVWEQGCLEEVCGSCSLLVNGYPRQACTALIAQHLKEGVVTIAPLSKFPLVRDLIVDRSIMFENLKRVRGWVGEQGSKGEDFGPLISQKTQELLYVLSTCMTCGCCSEGCPQVNKKSAFMGPAPISQARLFNAHPIGSIDKKKRIETLMDKGGLSECGNAQNCVEVCPKKIPLTESIGAMGRQLTMQALVDDS